MNMEHEKTGVVYVGENGWCASSGGLPKPKSRIIATNKKADQSEDDWSGYPKLIGALYFTGDVFLNESGAAFSIETFRGRTAAWVYAPPGYEMPFEYRKEEPIRFTD